MEVLNQNKVQEVINESLKKSISYQEYRSLVSDLVAKEATTGTEQTEALVNYTMLNDRRMKRWDKTVKLSDEIKSLISAVDKKITILVITESWCGDAAHVMPVVNKIAELNTNIDYRVVLRGENNALMDAFLTNGSRSIAKFIFLDTSSSNVLNSYGPRPTEATQLVEAFKAQHHKLTPEFKEDLQRWYNKDKGQNVLNDLVEILK